MISAIIMLAAAVTDMLTYEKGNTPVRRWAILICLFVPIGDLIYFFFIR